MPYWFKLIYYWTQVENRSGLSIPFVLGAGVYYGLTDKIISADITELLEDMDEYQDEKFVITFFRCNDIGAHVFGMFPRVNAAYYNGRSASVSGNLLFAKGVECGNTVKEGVEFIEGIYGDEIEKQHFSMNQNIWGPFTSFDIDILEKAREFNP